MENYYLTSQGHHMIVQECDEGYDFTLYDNNDNLIDGGVLTRNHTDDEQETFDIACECLRMISDGEVIIAGIAKSDL